MNILLTAICFLCAAINCGCALASDSVVYAILALCCAACGGYGIKCCLIEQSVKEMRQALQELRERTLGAISSEFEDGLFHNAVDAIEQYEKKVNDD